MENMNINTEVLIDKTLEEATNIITNNGYRLRIVKKDGVPFVITRDYRLDRINLELENDKVVKTSIG